MAEYLPLIFTLLAVGGVAGLSAGLFGIGGGAVMVPALYFAFDALGVPQDVVMHSAVATSSAIIIVNAIRSTRSHHKHGAVDWDLLWPKNPLLSYALWIGLGAFVAAIWLAPKMSGQALTLLFAIVAGLISLQFIFGRPDWTLRETVPGGVARPLVGGTVGVLSSLMGIIDCAFNEYLRRTYSPSRGDRIRVWLCNSCARDDWIYPVRLGRYWTACLFAWLCECFGLCFGRLYCVSNDTAGG